MIAHQYDSDGYYIGEIEDYGLLPNNATYKKPKNQNGFIPKWNGSKWMYVEDHKGEEGFLNGEPFTITDYGPYPDGFSKERSEAELLEISRKAKMAEIEAAYQAALAASLTMPQNNPNQTDIAIGAALFANEDAEGLEYLVQQHTETRDILVKEVIKAETLDELAGIEIKFMV